MLNTTGELQPGHERNRILNDQLRKIQDAVNALYTPGIRTVFTTATNLGGNLTYADWYVYVDATNAAAKLVLPPVRGAVRAIRVKKIDSSGNSVTVTVTGSDLIDGAATKVLAAQWNSTTFAPGPNGNWYIF